VVEVKMNGKQLMAHLREVLRKYLPHRWAAKWDLHNRQRFLETFPAGTLSMMTDFSAMYDNNPQYRLNSAIPEHSLQDVWVVSHSPRMVKLPNGTERRVIDNDIYHFWATSCTGKLENNHYYHLKCFEWLLGYCRDVLKLIIEFISFFTDGCAAQYKLRRNALMLCELAVRLGIVVDHTYAPTACFKTVVDSAGNDAKEFMRKLERDEVEGARAPTARDVFTTLRDKMPQPEARDEASCSLLSFTRRIHVLLVDISDARASDFDDPFIIVTNQREEQKDCRAIAGIQSIYNLQARPESSSASPPCVWLRDHPCACDSCQARDRGACATTAVSGAWKKKRVLPVTRRDTPAPVGVAVPGDSAFAATGSDEVEDEVLAAGEENDDVQLFQFSPVVDEEEGIDISVEG
jgi:hypothetical protein